MNRQLNIPSGSQTVGPYFRIGLDYLLDRTPASDPHAAGIIELSGRVLDRDGAPVSDALLELWSSGASLNSEPTPSGFPRGFRRAPTDDNGCYRVEIEQPISVSLADGRQQAPHLLVLFHSRGLLRNLITRVYPCGDSSVATDPVLQLIRTDRRSTLIAQPQKEKPNGYVWNIILQGQNETVFFEW